MRPGAGERGEIEPGLLRHAARQRAGEDAAVAAVAGAAGAGGCAGAGCAAPAPAGCRGRRWPAAGCRSRLARVSPSARGILALAQQHRDRLLTLTPCVPSGTRILPIRPSSTASNSIVALSVSISASTSPDLTSSPSFFSHLASLPSVMVGDSAGIRISIGMRSSFGLVDGARRLAVGDLARRGDDVLDLRHRQVLEIGGIGQRHVLAGDPLHRRVEPVEGTAPSPSPRSRRRCRRTASPPRPRRCGWSS